MNREVKTLIQNLAKEMKLKAEDVERVYEAPFALMAIVMKYRCDKDKEYFPSLRIPYFGIFHCPPWNRRRMQKIKKRIENSKKEVEGSSHPFV